MRKLTKLEKVRANLEASLEMCQRGNVNAQQEIFRLNERIAQLEREQLAIMVLCGGKVEEP